MRHLQQTILCLLKHGAAQGSEGASPGPAVPIRGDIRDTRSGCLTPALRWLSGTPHFPLATGTPRHPDVPLSSLRPHTHTRTLPASHTQHTPLSHPLLPTDTSHTFRAPFLHRGAVHTPNPPVPTERPTRPAGPPALSRGRQGRVPGVPPPLPGPAAGHPHLPDAGGQPGPGVIVADVELHVDVHGEQAGPRAPPPGGAPAREGAAPAPGRSRCGRGRPALPCPALPSARRLPPGAAAPNRPGSAAHAVPRAGREPREPRGAVPVPRQGDRSPTAGWH